MVRRALVIGSTAASPLGVDNDVAGMSAMLEARGFKDVWPLVGAAATRDGILAAYDQLICDTEDGSEDAVVIYYAGHGGSVITIDDPREPRLPRRFQCIIPSDYPIADATGRAGGADEFHGISAFELSLLQARLTRRCRNVTAIFDCCHSAQMSRSVRTPVAPRALAAPSRLAMTRHVQDLHRRYADVWDDSAAGNREAVRIVACGADDSAWPVQDREGAWYGAMTLGLLRTLAEIREAAVSWRSIIDQVARQVKDACPDQRPDVEGPHGRRAFSLEEVGGGSVSIRRVPGGFTLAAGSIAGITTGDVYAAVALDAPDRELARVRVTQTTPLSAAAALVSWAPGASELPSGAIAVPRELAAPRAPVHVEADAPDALARIAREISRAPRLRVATDGDLGAIATLAVVRDELRLRDASGLLIPVSRFPERLPDAIAIAARLAAARQLLALEGEHGVMRSELEAEWGTTELGVPNPRPEHGARLTVRDRIYLRLRNTGRGELFANVFNIGLRGNIVSLSRGVGAAIRLPHGEQIVLNESATCALVGYPLHWPADLPREHERIDTLLVIVTRTAVDLRVLETGPAPGVSRGPASPPLTAEPYLMLRLTYWLTPP